MAENGKAGHDRNQDRWKHAGVLATWTAVLVKLAQLIISVLR